MMNFVIIALGVMFGTLLASFVMLSIVMNKRVLKWYTKRAMQIGEEISDELLDDMFDK